MPTDTRANTLLELHKQTGFPVHHCIAGANIPGGLSLALIGNASGKEFPGRRKLTPEAFSIRRLGGSRWRLRRTR
jgi:hypothetical protein